MMPGPYATHPYQPPGLAPGSTSGGKSGQEGGDSDHDNRTRNAKAQKRHREKRKAHVKGVSAMNWARDGQTWNSSIR